MMISRRRERGFIINPFVFGGGPPAVPTWNSADKSGNIVLSDGDTVAATSTSSEGGVRSLSSHGGTDLAYAEFEFLAGIAGSRPYVGLCTAANGLNVINGNSATNWIMRTDGVARHNFSNTSNLIGAVSNGHIVMLAINFSTGRLWFGKNGSWSGNPAAGTGQAFSSISGATPLYLCYSSASAGQTVKLKTSAAVLTYSPPSGFGAWD